MRESSHRSRGHARLLLLLVLAASGIGLGLAGRDPASPPPGEPAQNAPSSPGVSDLVPLAAGQVLYVATSAHAPGAAGSVWWTDLECHNPGSTQASYSIALLKHASNNASPTSVSYSLDPGKSVRYPDLINTVFAWSNGKAALRIAVSSGSLLVTSRTYNHQPSGTYGQFVPAFADADAISFSDEGRLIQLTHQPNLALGSFRTNLGVVNATSAPIAVSIDLFRSNGAFLGSVPLNLQPYDYQQVDKITERVTSAFVDDAYAIVRTSSPSGRFFAYASVIDNATSDPICVPAVKLPRSASLPTPTPTSPPPTATPTPPSSLTTVGAYEAATDIFNGLGKLGTGSIPSIEGIVHIVQSSGLDALNTTLIQRYPSIVSAIPNGIKANFGTGTTLPSGAVLSGSASVTYSNLLRSASSVSLNYNASATNLKKNGSLIPLSSASGSLNLAVDPSGHVSGNLTTNATGSSPQGPVSLSGSAHIDTSICPNYPISGSVTVTDAGLSKTITFNSKCDGTFDYASGTAKIWQLDMPWPDCPGIGSGWFSPTFMAENGHLSVIPMGGLNNVYHSPTGSGWYNSTAAHVDYELFWNFAANPNPGHQFDQYRVVFDGTLADAAAPKYVGTFNVQAKHTLVDGSVHSCSYSCNASQKPCGCLQGYVGWFGTCPVS